jgi:predicted nucleic acid-binding protein
MVIVDSSVWIDAFRGASNDHCRWLYQALGNEDIALTSLILAEVLQGIQIESQFLACRRQLLALHVLDSLSSEVAVAAARNARALRARGITVRKTVDCIIATVCLEEGHQLLHRDRDFDAFEMHLGLRVIHP